MSALLGRAVPFTSMSTFFGVEAPEKPGDKDFGIPARVGVVGEGSNPDLVGV